MRSSASVQLRMTLGGSSELSLIFYGAFDLPHVVAKEHSSYPVGCLELYCCVYGGDYNAHFLHGGPSYQ